MDKNAIKKYAIWARRELIERVSQRAMMYGISAEKAGDPNADSINGHLLSLVEKRQRQALIRNISEKGYEQVMEEVAYTWFNRFAALRFMEVNGYLPSHIRVFTNDAGEFKPQILSEAIHLELDGLDMNKVYELESANESEELFKYLLIVQCNALNSILPGMFQRIEDYTELLLPDYLLREGSVIEQMVTSISETDWTDQVQIIGWLYEAYNTELNSLVYDGSLSKTKIPKELIPAATTIFTPDWPVQYMVENSLGRLWLEGHNNNDLKSQWKYYLEESIQVPNVQATLTNIRKKYELIKPEELLVIDPCAGSGHILCVLFDTLVNIYESYGYTAREAAGLIVQNNLWGLDINDRAAQLAYFAVMMKARQYDRRFFAKEIQPHVYSIQESNGINRNHLKYLGNGLNDNERDTAINQMNALLDDFIDAKEYGSIIHPNDYDWALLNSYITATISGQLSLETEGLENTQLQLEAILNQGQALAQKYHVVVTNPPYLGSNRFGGKLDQFVKKHYSDVKSDLSMVMYKHVLDEMVLPSGFVSFITTSSWMFLTSFEKLRIHMKNNATISTLVDFGTELFDGKVGHNPIVSWVIRKDVISAYYSTAIRLVDYCYARRNEKKTEFFLDRNRHVVQQDSFEKIPGVPIAYWVSERFLSAFEMGRPLGDCIPVKKGMDTGDNNSFLRLWHEVGFNKIDLFTAKKKWIPYDKGGDFRKWYGNNSYVLNWENDGFALKNSKANLRSQNLYFRESITWNALSSGNTCFRHSTYKGAFDSAGSSMFPNPQDIPFYLGLMNSKISQYYLDVINPTLNYGAGSVSQVPVLKVPESLKKRVSELSNACVKIYKQDWDSMELSWDFKRHPLINGNTTISASFSKWAQDCETRYNQLTLFEEELNSIFIDVYGLSDELSPEVADITICKADLHKDIKSFISYAVGCMFGRYSLDVDGLIYTGVNWDNNKYKAYFPDSDGIIPICDDEYFEDDIIGRFVEFVEIVYGKSTLEDNLRCIADALGGQGSSREVIRNYFNSEFYADHLKAYQKRPIYWLFDSGKKNGFKCLIYMHRYQPDTIARIRTDYVHELQSRYRTAIDDLEQRVDNASGSERVKLSKQMAKLQAQEEEVRVYEEKIHHLADQMIEIDLDDGVKHNYALFKDVLAKIK